MLKRLGTIYLHWLAVSHHSFMQVFFPPWPYLEVLGIEPATSLCKAHILPTNYDLSPLKLPVQNTMCVSTWNFLHAKHLNPHFIAHSFVLLLPKVLQMHHSNSLEILKFSMHKVALVSFGAIKNVHWMNFLFCISAGTPLSCLDAVQSCSAPSPPIV